MFRDCENLTDLDLSNFKNENVEDISFMFSNCKNLKKLDFSNFKVNNAKIDFIFLNLNKKCVKKIADPKLL
jgi:surface protein